MSAYFREWCVLGLVFLGVVVFVFKFIVQDLPDDFLSKCSERAKKSKGGR
jgi:hypothetical protein